MPHADETMATPGAFLVATAAAPGTLYQLGIELVAPSDGTQPKTPLGVVWGMLHAIEATPKGRPTWKAAMAAIRDLRMTEVQRQDLYDVLLGGLQRVLKREATSLKDMAELNNRHLKSFLDVLLKSDPDREVHILHPDAPSDISGVDAVCSFIRANGRAQEASRVQLAESRVSAARFSGAADERKEQAEKLARKSIAKFVATANRAVKTRLVDSKGGVTSKDHAELLSEIGRFWEKRVRVYARACGVFALPDGTSFTPSIPSLPNDPSPTFSLASLMPTLSRRERMVLRLRGAGRKVGWSMAVLLGLGTAGLVAKLAGHPIHQGLLSIISLTPDFRMVLGSIVGCLGLAGWGAWSFWSCGPARDRMAKDITDALKSGKTIFEKALLDPFVAAADEAVKAMKKFRPPHLQPQLDVLDEIEKVTAALSHQAKAEMSGSSSKSEARSRKG